MIQTSINGKSFVDYIILTCIPTNAVVVDLDFISRSLKVLVLSVIVDKFT
jgi:hypothetical protein